jgi:hypothetical protein
LLPHEAAAFSLPFGKRTGVCTHLYAIEAKSKMDDHNQKAMAELDGVPVPAMSKHLNNIDDEVELGHTVSACGSTRTDSSNSPSLPL